VIGRIGDGFYMGINVFYKIHMNLMMLQTKCNNFTSYHEKKADVAFFDLPSWLINPVCKKYFQILCNVLKTICSSHTLYISAIML